MKSITSLLVALVVGLAMPGLWAAAPAGQYTINSTGTAVDNKSGLVWQQGHSALLATWGEANKYCTDLPLAGLSGWRLPTRFELETLIDVGALKPAIDTKTFLDTPNDYFWTSTPWVEMAGNYWAVYFWDGSSFFITGDAYARCVR